MAALLTVPGQHSWGSPRASLWHPGAECHCQDPARDEPCGAALTALSPAARIIKTKQWCEMLPCLEGEGCDLLINRSGWTCTQPGGRIKTTTVRAASACGGGGSLRRQSPGTWLWTCGHDGTGGGW